ncbi:MAG: hypothetical protein NC095_09635 [Muribaculum sp.]|nr:hypothetical protein [Muribaculum sp.]
MKKTIIILLAILAYGIPSIYSQIQVSKISSIEVTGTSTITIDPSVDPDSDSVYWEAIQSALEDAKAKAEFIQPYFGAGELYPWMVLEDDPEDYVDNI